MIRKENGKFVVYSESGRKFGEYSTEGAAKKRLQQMEYFKHMKKQAAIPPFVLSSEASKALKAKISKSLAKSIIKNPNSKDGIGYTFKYVFGKALTPAAKKLTYKDYANKAKQVFNKLKNIRR